MTIECEWCNGNGGFYANPESDEWIVCSECDGRGYYYASPEDDPSLWSSSDLIV